MLVLSTDRYGVLNTVLAEAVADDLATLTLENDSVAISLGVDGTGSFDVVENDSDATPTI